ncbi:MAG: DUF3784 domain-containing protein [Ruminococcaceae bacterium]|nr:DUF3784 domain-containing protein [Oscillospiraceae bacterium]
MILYSCIVLPVAIIFFILSSLIYKGKTELIHDYHQTNVKDKAAYGKGFGKALGVMSAGIFLSGIIGLFGDDKITAMVAVIVLFAGLFIGLFCIYKVQKKYNSGIF